MAAILPYITVLWTFLYFSWFSGMTAQNCPVFPEIPEANYNRTYATFQNPEVRPLGFVSCTALYNIDPSKQPCYSISGQTGQQFDILFETIPSANLCFSYSGIASTVCATGQKSYCVNFPQSTTLQIQFSLEKGSGASESDVKFWLRITLGPGDNTDPENYWCSTRPQQFPTALLQVDEKFLPNVGTGHSPSKANTQQPCIAAVLLIAVTLACLHRP